MKKALTRQVLPKSNKPPKEKKEPKDVVFTKPDTLTRYLIGIDCGNNTGLAIFDRQKDELIHVKLYNILDAIDFVREFSNKFYGKVTLFVENPYTFVTFGGQGYKAQCKAQGAGSVKAHFRVWALLSKKDLIPMVGTSVIGTQKKVGEAYFRQITGYKGELPTSEDDAKHCIDAGLIVYKRTSLNP